MKNILLERVKSREGKTLYVVSYTPVVKRSWAEKALAQELQRVEKEVMKQAEEEWFPNIK